MNADVEQGLVNYLTPRLESLNLTATVLPGTGGGSVPNSQPSVICVVDLPHTVGKLYLANERIIISTPSQVTGWDVNTHRALVKAVREQMAWDADDEQAIAKSDAMEQALFSASQFHHRGFFFQRPFDAQDEGLWQTTLEIMRGLEGPSNV